MKKFLLPIAAMLLCMTACNKDNEGILKLEVEQYTSDAKAHLDSENYAVWDDDDQVRVNGFDYAVSVNNLTHTATLADVAESTTGYKAVYPASWASTDGASIIYPRTQTYRTNGTAQVIDAPMAAYATSGNLKFHNLGAILAVNVTNGTAVDAVIDTIEVTAASGTLLNGTAAIDYDNGSISALSGGSDTIILDLVDASTNVGVTIPREGKQTFFIALPPTTAQLSIKVKSGIWQRTISQGEAHSFAASNGYNAPFTFLPPNNEIWYTATSQKTPTTNGTTSLATSSSDTYYGATFNSSLYKNSKGVWIFNDAVTKVPDNGFRYGGSSFLSLTLPMSVATVGMNACGSNSGMTAAVMPGATTIGNSIFTGCSNFSYFSAPNVVTMGTNVFSNTKVTALSFPNLTTIGSTSGSPFSNAKSLVSVSIPNLTTFNLAFFTQCSALKNVWINSVTTLKGNVFYGCTSLENVYCTTAAPTISGSNNFNNVPATAVLHLTSNCSGIANWSATGSGNTWPGTISYDFVP